MIAEFYGERRTHAKSLLFHTFTPTCISRRARFWNRRQCWQLILSDDVFNVGVGGSGFAPCLQVTRGGGSEHRSITEATTVRVLLTRLAYMWVKRREEEEKVELPGMLLQMLRPVC